ncbi:MAG TPA: hypothetical protein VHG28_19490 [Longimicrobiaceae bacterium]|nr:hypothetical protein [Longimicrobiaceae bacterium]
MPSWFFLLCILVPAVHAPVHAQAARPASPPAAAGPVVIHSTPGGDTLAVLPEDAQVQAVGRQGEWTRVRVEGWTRSPVGGSAAAGSLSPSALRANPDAHRGTRVTWSARFLALQRADPVRTDFTPGELYVLARDPNGEPGFVYLAVTPQQALAMKRLLPLQPFTFVGRVRTGASPLMGHPVLELVELRS